MTSSPSPALTPVYVAGNATIHAGRKIGQYASGSPRYAKLCGSSRNDRHDPMPVGDVDAEITCKRCLAKIAKRDEQAARKAELDREDFPQLSERKTITNPTVHLFASTSDAYDETQTRDDIRDGDVLVVESEGVVGFLHRAWPVALSDEHGAFHTLADDADVSCLGKSDERDLGMLTIHPDDGEPYQVHDVIPADPGTDYSASVELARELIDEQREHFARVDAMSDEQRAYFADHDERELADYFPRYSRVSVRHAFGGHELARGEVVGYVLGWHDSGSPESGPGPVERCELVRVKCDDDSVRNVYPGDLDPADHYDHEGASR